jgi:hypothetical protein
MKKLPFDIEGPYSRPNRLTTFQKIWITLVVVAFAAIGLMAIFN